MVCIVALEELKFIIEESGAQCVVFRGPRMMSEWCVESWAVVLLWQVHVMLILDRDQGESGWIMCIVRDPSPH